MSAQIEITAAFSLWRKIRDLVNRMKFEGHELYLWESTGWFRRDFIIKGNRESLLEIMKIFTDYQEQWKERNG